MATTKSQIVARIHEIAEDVHNVLTDDEIESMWNLMYMRTKDNPAYVKIKDLALNKYDVDIQTLWELIRQLRPEKEK